MILLGPVLKSKKTCQITKLPSCLASWKHRCTLCSSLSRESWAIWGRVYRGHWPRSSIPETVIGLKSHKMQNLTMWAEDAAWNLSWGLWIWGKAEGYLMQALLQLWWAWSMTVPLSSSSPRGWAQPFTRVQPGSCCSLKSLPKVKPPPELFSFFPQTTTTESSVFFGVSNRTRSCQWQSTRQEGLDLIFPEKANLTEMFVFTLLFNIPASGKLQELVPMACFSCSLPWQIEINIFRFLSFPWKLSLPPFPRSHKLCFGLQTINFSHYSF